MKHKIMQLFPTLFFFFYDKVKFNLPNIQVGSAERVVPGCCTINRFLGMTVGRVTNGPGPGQCRGQGVGWEGQGEVSVRGDWPGWAVTLRDPWAWAANCQPLWVSTQGTHTRGWADRPSQTCQQLLRSQPPPASQYTRQTEAPLNPPPGYPPTRVLNSKNSQNIWMVTYEMLSCIFLSQR